MTPHLKTKKLGIAAIIENLLKRRWSLAVLRHIEKGSNDSSAILLAEPEITPDVLNKILRTMIRYRLLVRHQRSITSGIVVYQVTELGVRMLEILTLIEQFDHGFSSEKTPGQVPALRIPTTTNAKLSV